MTIVPSRLATPLLVKRGLQDIMNRYSFSRPSLLFIILLITSSCVPTQSPRQGAAATRHQPAHTLTAVFGALPKSLSPHGPHSWYKAQILPLLYNGLITLDRNLRSVPALASRWEVSPDGLIYTVYLRRQVLFHDGKKLEAADVRYSFEQAATRRRQSSRDDSAPFAFIADIQTPDRHTVRFILKQPYAPFLTKLTVAYCPIIAQRAISASQLVPPGTGPFRVVSFQPGRTIVLRKFASYWESGLPRLDAIRFQVVESAAARLQLMRSEEVDFVLLEPGALSDGFVEVNTAWEIVRSAPTGVFSMVFNTQRRPFTDVNVRRAFAWALNKVALMRDVLGEFGVPVAQPFSPGVGPWHIAITDRKRDFAQAKALLDKAGYPEGINVSLPVIADAAVLVKTALALQEQLRRVGIHLQVELLPPETVFDRMKQGEWDLLLRGEESKPDPDDVYFGAFHSSKVGTSNVSGYHTPTLDTLLVNGRRTLDFHKRRQTYKQVVKNLQKDVPELYLFMARWPVGWHQRVQGYDHELLRCCFLQSLTSIANQGFKTIWLDK